MTSAPAGDRQRLFRRTYLILGSASEAEAVVRSAPANDRAVLTAAAQRGTNDTADRSVTIHDDANWDACWQALDALSFRQRTATVLHHGEGMSVAEIADLLDVEPEAVGPLLGSASKRVGQVLGPAPVEERIAETLRRQGQSVTPPDFGERRRLWRLAVPLVVALVGVATAASIVLTGDGDNQQATDPTCLGVPLAQAEAALFRSRAQLFAEYPGANDVRIVACDDAYQLAVYVPAARADDSIGSVPVEFRTAQPSALERVTQRSFGDDSGASLQRRPASEACDDPVRCQAELLLGATAGPVGREVSSALDAGRDELRVEAAVRVDDVAAFVASVPEGTALVHAEFADGDVDLVEPVDGLALLGNAAGQVLASLDAFDENGELLATSSTEGAALFLRHTADGRPVSGGAGECRLPDPEGFRVGPLTATGEIAVETGANAATVRLLDGDVVVDRMTPVAGHAILLAPEASDALVIEALSGDERLIGRQPPGGVGSLDDCPVASSGDVWNQLDAGPLEARTGASAVWTGDELIVWGGAGVADGAAYAPESDSWRSLAPSLLSQRSGHHVAWTGSEMLVVGGRQTVEGAAYSPAADEWRLLPPLPVRLGESDGSVWTGDTFVVWDSQSNRVFEYDPSADAWDELASPPLSGQTNALHWTGDTLVAVAASGSQLLVHMLREDGWFPDRIVNMGAEVDADLTAWSGNELVAWTRAGRDGGAVALETGAGTRRTIDPPPLNACDEVGSTVFADGQVLAWSGCGGLALFDAAADTWISLGDVMSSSEVAIDSPVWTGEVLLTWSGLDGATQASLWSYEPPS